VTELFGFPYAYPVTGQTYSRKIDADVLGPLSSFGATVHKMATDSKPSRISARSSANNSSSTRQLEGDRGAFREGSNRIFCYGLQGQSFLLQARSADEQRNPMRCERACSLSRHLMVIYQNTLMTASVQWLERTLDDRYALFPSTLRKGS